MSNSTEQFPWPDGSDPRPGAEQYRRRRHIRHQSPETVTDGRAETTDSTGQELLAEQNHQHLPSTPSLSTATTLVESQPTRQSDALHISLSQHSLARPLEEASYSPASSQLDFSQLDESSEPNTPDSYGAVSQHSLARPLEEATYAQETSQPLSEPASSQAASTQSSGLYMPIAFLRWQHNAWVSEHSSGAVFTNFPDSPMAMSLEDSPEALQTSGSDGAASVNSFARPIEECHPWDASPPPSLLLEADEDMISARSRPKPARPPEELAFAENEPVVTESYSRTRSAGLGATPRPQVAQAMDELDRHPDLQCNTSPAGHQTLTSRRLEALQSYRVGWCTPGVVGDPNKRAIPEVASHAELASSQHSFARPLEIPGIYDYSRSQAAHLSISPEAEPHDVAAQRLGEPNQGPRNTFHRRCPPYNRRMTLARRQSEPMAELVSTPPISEYPVMAPDNETGLLNLTNHTPAAPTTCFAEPSWQQQATAPTGYVSAAQNLRVGPQVWLPSRSESPPEENSWVTMEDLAGSPGVYETDRVGSARWSDQPSHLWQHRKPSEEHARINRWLELTEPPRGNG